MAHTRPWPAPPRDGVTIQQLTDTHFGYEPWSFQEADSSLGDFTSAMIEHTQAVIHTGDITDDGGQVSPSTPAEDGIKQDSYALSWLPKASRGLPDLWCTGNHDLRDRTAGNTRVQWENVYGRKANTYLDVPGMRFISLSPDSCDRGTSPRGSHDPWIIPQATLDWADSVIASAPDRVVLCNHYPLVEMGAPDWPEPEDGMDALISDNPKVFAYLSGHMHWQPNDARVTQLLTVGNRQHFPAICATSLPFHPPSVDGGDAYIAGHYSSAWSTWHTFLDDRIEVRFRNHGARMWGGPGGLHVVTLNVTDGSITVT